VLTVAALGVRVAASAAAVWTVTVAVAAFVATGRPLFASVPLAEAFRVRVPTVPVEQPVYWKFTVAPPATGSAPGVPVQLATAMGVTALAVTAPLFRTASVAVKT
jgi:hypothetical protein